MDLPSAYDMRRMASGERRPIHNAAFDHALSKASKLIKEAARQRHASLAYELPEFVMGCPTFKVQDCVDYVVAAMRCKGFDVKQIGDKVIVVSWEFRSDARSDAPQNISVPSSFRDLKL